MTRSRWADLVAQCAREASVANRRQETRRFALGATARLAFEKSGRPATQFAGVLNVSTDGVMLKSANRIAYGTAVVLQLAITDEPVILAGRVIHCTQTVGGYKVGIELQFQDEPA